MIPKVVEDVNCSICGGSEVDYSEGYIVFECPECSISFCSHCLQFDSTDMLCPNCGQILEFPNASDKS